MDQHTIYIPIIPYLFYLALGVAALVLIIKNFQAFMFLSFIGLIVLLLFNAGAACLIFFVIWLPIALFAGAISVFDDIYKAITGEK
jgi:hypothetical protein